MSSRTNYTIQATFDDTTILQTFGVHGGELRTRPSLSGRFRTLISRFPEVGQLSRMGEKPAPRTEHVHGARTSPLQQNRAVQRDDVLSVLGVLHHRRLRRGDIYKVYRNKL